MDRTIEVKVNGSYITKDNRNAGVQHEANSTSLRIEFDPSWDSYAKKITWWDAKGEDPVEITLGTNLLEDAAASTRIYLCPIPGEPLAECGECTFVIDGYVDGKRQRSAADQLWVKEAPFKENAGQPSDPTPSQAEQLQKEIDGIKGTISQAAASRDAAAESAAQAKASETEAASSASAAAKSETAAGGSAASAAADASAAAKSAEAAAQSKQNAEASETSAKSSATTASSAAATAAQAKTAAESSETAAAASEKTAKSWAVGGTGTRVGEDTNNAKYWSERASAIAGGDFATKAEARGYVDAHNQSSAAHADLRQAIESKEDAGAAAAVQQELDAHTGNATIHITAEERAKWNVKEEGGAAAAVQENLTAHIDDTVKHVTAEERAKWNGKADLVDGKVPSSQLPAADGFTKEETLKAATAALFGKTNAAVPDDILSLLSKSVLAQTAGKHTKHTLSECAEGSLVKLAENGVLVDFYVAKHNYESGLNGAGRTLLVRKDCYDERVWHSSRVNAYASSNIDSWLNSTYKNLLDANIREAIGTTKIKYTPGNGNNNVGTLERGVFLLSVTEMGETGSEVNTEGTALGIASSLKSVYLNGSICIPWSRSPYTGGSTTAYYLRTGGGINDAYCNDKYGSRPCFTLPSTFTWYTDSSGDIYTEQEYETVLTDVLGTKLTVGVQIETGSYVGTGTYGQANPNTLTFGFVPKLVIVLDANRFFAPAVMVYGSSFATSAGANSSDYYLRGITWGKEFSWYNTTNANNQLNINKFTYYYIAIG